MIQRRHNTVRIMLALGVWLGGAASAWALHLTPAQQERVFNEALQAFDRASSIRQSDSGQAIEAYRESAAKFQLLVDSGLRNGRLYYNLANACLESGELGRAIANYRRAQQLRPGDGRIEQNLRYARSLCEDQITPAGQKAFWRTLFFWHYGTSLRGRYVFGLVVYLLFWAMMVGWVFAPRLPWRYALVPILILCLVVAGSVATQSLGQSQMEEGVLVADDVVVRKGNGEAFDPQFAQSLHQGVEFIIIEHRHDWLQIELPDGKTGWIRADQAEPI